MKSAVNGELEFDVQRWEFVETRAPGGQRGGWDWSDTTAIMTADLLPAKKKTRGLAIVCPDCRFEQVVEFARSARLQHGIRGDKSVRCAKCNVLLTMTYEGEKVQGGTIWRNKIRVEEENEHEVKAH